MYQFAMAHPGWTIIALFLVCEMVIKVSYNLSPYIDKEDDDGE